MTAEQEERSEPVGPPMVVATSVLKPPRARISNLGGNITLPRSIEVRQLVAGIIGAIAGMIVWMFPVGLLFSYRLGSLFYTMAFGAAIAVGSLYLQPLKGESLLTWARLILERRRGRLEFGGRDLRVHVGVERLDRTALGAVRIVPSAVEVAPGSYDERGAPVRRRFTAPDPA